MSGHFSLRFCLNCSLQSGLSVIQPDISLVETKTVVAGSEINMSATNVTRVKTGQVLEMLLNILNHAKKFYKRYMDNGM